VERVGCGPVRTTNIEPLKESGFGPNRAKLLTACGPIIATTMEPGARGSIVGKALGYKPEGRGFETRCAE
jgi:hypothetical protein